MNISFKRFRRGALFAVALLVSTSFGFTAESLPLIPPQVKVPPQATAEKSDPQPKESLTLGFWNIRWFPGHHPVRQDEQSRAKQKEAVEQRIGQWKPDILFASEIRGIDALKSLDVDHPYRACTDIPRTEDENPDLPQQGLGVLSRIPWEEAWVLDFSQLPLSGDKPSRGILAVQFKLPSGSLLTCYAVHLKSNRGGIDATWIRRQRAVDYLRWDWKRKDLDPAKDWIMVLGDFNTSMEDPAFEVDRTLEYLMSFGFDHAGEGLPREERLTIHASRYPANDFDHIFLSTALSEALGGKERPRAEVRKVPSEVSDHNAIFLDMALGGRVN